MSPFVWIGFILLVLVMLAIDLGVFNKKPHVVQFKEAMGWLCVWVGLALACNVFIYFMFQNHWFMTPDYAGNALSGFDAATQYLTGYLVELSLSVDNIFVIAIIFQYFRVPMEYQHRVLFWGILGAIILRGVMIAIGAALIKQFDWVIYVFGAFLIITAVKMLFVKHEDIEPEKNLVVRITKRFMPVLDRFEGSKFIVRIDGKRYATPLFVCLMLIETTDLIFAFDSIPAIFGITQDAFIVFASNLFAILGLRTMYFGLSGLLARFRFLSKALIFVLAFVGIKMCIHHWVEISNLASLAVVLGMLGLGIVLSLVIPEKKAEAVDAAAD